MSDLISGDKELESLKIEKQIANEKAEIAQRKAVEAEMKQKYGRDWKKILGFIKPKASAERLHDLYAISPDLRDVSIPRKIGF